LAISPASKKFLRRSCAADRRQTPNQCSTRFATIADLDETTDRSQCPRRIIRIFVTVAQQNPALLHLPAAKLSSPLYEMHFLAPKKIGPPVETNSVVREK
jgi:hypothetical protein